MRTPLLPCWSWDSYRVGVTEAPRTQAWSEPRTLVIYANRLPAHQSLGHWDPLRTSSGWTLPGPFEIGHSNSIRLDQFRKNSWCSVGIDGYREAFVRPAWISMLSGGLSPIPICRRNCARATTSCGTRAVVEGLFMGIVLASVSLTALRSGDRWAGISAAYAVWNLFNTLYPRTRPGSALFVITAFSGGSGNSSRRTVVPV